MVSGGLTEVLMLELETNWRGHGPHRHLEEEQRRPGVCTERKSH